MKFVPDGLLVTFQITIISLCFVIPIGLFTGLGKLSRCRPINLLASTYVEIIRGIPLLMQLFYIYYALGSMLKVSPTVAAVAALSICYGAYMGEVFRAGILSVPKGQSEAARSLGFNRFQTMTLVILPQALRTIIPPWATKVSPCSRTLPWFQSLLWPMCFDAAANMRHRPLNT